jgi:hypothetical protein
MIKEWNESKWNEVAFSARRVELEAYLIAGFVL